MNCLNCGSATSNPKFCSLSCGAKHQQAKARASRTIKTKHCTYCQSLFAYGADSGTRKTSKDRFCNRSCAASYNGSRYPKRSKLEGGRNAERQCPYCGILFVKRTTWCSRDCWKDDRNRLKVELFLNGDPDIATTSDGCSRWARELVMEQNDYACSKCGWDEKHPVDGKLLIQIDHIDGDWKNNRITNLQVLCPNCHSKTPTFGIRNRGNGRDYRREWRSQRTSV